MQQTPVQSFHHFLKHWLLRNSYNSTYFSPEIFFLLKYGSWLIFSFVACVFVVLCKKSFLYGVYDSLHLHFFPLKVVPFKIVILGAIVQIPICHSSPF